MVARRVVHFGSEAETQSSSLQFGKLGDRVALLRKEEWFWKIGNMLIPIDELVQFIKTISSL